MSKFLCLGVPLEDIVRRTTLNPAQMIQRPELGNLSVGSTADMAVFEIVKGKFAYLGSGGGKIEGNQKLQCVMTIFGGKILYDHPYGLSVPLWQDIAKTRGTGQTRRSRRSDEDIGPQCPLCCGRAVGIAGEGEAC